MMDQSVLAIIPARGGSKGIPHKNLRSVVGRPLVAHSIETALQARSVTRVVVSTDDPAIADVAGQYGADVVDRPVEISGDTASSESALLHVLEYLEKTEGYRPDLLVFLQCTSPLTTPEDIDGTVRALLKENADSAFSVAPFHDFVWKKDENGDMTGVNHDKNIRLRRQDRQEQFLETGAVYAMRVVGFQKAKHRFFGKLAVHVTPRERFRDIDELVDLDIADLLLRKQLEDTQRSLLPDRVSALVLDFDGVLTDNRVVVSEEGQEAVLCSRGDGLGLSRVKKAGIAVLVLSTEENLVVSARCRKLGLECMQGITDKRATLVEWLQHRAVKPENTVYVGNDVNDVACLELVGCGTAVNDAHADVVKSARLVLSRRGGQGAIREVCDLILARSRRESNG